MAQKIHEPDSKVYDYKTQRLARGGKVLPLVAGLGAAYIGLTLGLSYDAFNVFPNYAWTNQFIQSHDFLTIHGYNLYYNPLVFIKPFYENIKYSIINTAIQYAGIPSVALGILVSFMFSKKNKDAQQAVLNNPVHGSARWATKTDVITSGLLPDSKNKKQKKLENPYKFDSKNICYVGAFVEDGVPTPLQHTGPEHILAFAPTRSGKGVGLVLPTLLDGWLDSCVVLDIKLENYQLTSGYRKSIGHKILRFSPGSLNAQDACHFNPLEEVRIGTDYEIKDIMNISTMIVDPDGKGLNDHWQKTGFALLTSVILHVLYTAPDKTLRGVAAYLNNPRLEKVDDAFNDMISTEHDPEFKFGWKDDLGDPTSVHPVIAQSAKEMLNKADNEKSGVISTMMSFLSLYRDPIVAGWTEFSDFKISDLQDDDSPVTLYIGVSPEDKNRLKPLIRLLLNQIASFFTSETRLKAVKGSIQCIGKHRLLMLLDEFPSLGKMDMFQDSIAFFAGYNIKLMLITQDIAQLEDEAHGYGKSGSKAIIGNCHVRVAYAPNQIETAEWISKSLGNKTITLENSNKNYDSTMLESAKGFSTSLQYQSRALLTPDEVMTLKGPEKEDGKIKKPGDLIVLVAGFQPIYGQQILYFMDDELLQRANIHHPDFSDIISPRKNYFDIFPNGGINSSFNAAFNKELEDIKQMLLNGDSNETNDTETESSDHTNNSKQDAENSDELDTYDDVEVY